MMRKGDWWQILLPASLVLAGAILLVGCFYIPTADVPVGKHPKDFRPLVGDDSSKSIRVGFTLRPKVVALLGKPVMQSEDGRSVGYIFATEHGLQVNLLCGRGWGPQNSENVWTAAHHSYGLRLDFDDEGKLVHYDMAEKEGEAEADPDASYSTSNQEILETLNRYGSRLVWIGTP